MIKEFQRACREVKEDSSRTEIWRTIIGQYRPTFLSQCENAVKWSKAFVEDELTTVMFEGDAGGRQKARRIVRKLTDFSGNKSHDRPIQFDECASMGLDVRLIEGDQTLQDFVLTAHHCYMNVFMNTPAYKVIENHLGAAIIKNVTQPA